MKPFHRALLQQQSGGAAPVAAGFKAMESYITSASAGTVDFSALNPAEGDLCVVVATGGNSVANSGALTGYTRVTSANSNGGVHHKVLADGETTFAYANSGSVAYFGVVLFTGCSFTSGDYNQCASLGGSNSTTAQSPGSRTAAIGSFLVAAVSGTDGSAVSAGSFAPTPLASDEAGSAGTSQKNGATAVYEGTGAGINAIHTHASSWAYSSNAGRYAAYAIIDPT